eukprot:8420651-Alexandrium_andersonii.AAC.1
MPPFEEADVGDADLVEGFEDSEWVGDPGSARPRALSPVLIPQDTAGEVARLAPPVQHGGVSSSKDGSALPAADAAEVRGLNELAEADPSAARLEAERDRPEQEA